MSRATITTVNRGPLPETWAELTAELPLRPIHDDIEYDNAVLFHYSAEHPCGPPMIEVQHAAQPLSAVRRFIGSI